MLTKLSDKGLNMLIKFLHKGTILFTVNSEIFARVLFS